MPKRFIKYSRTEPARTIIFVIAVMTLLAQAATVIPALGGLNALPNVVIVVPIGVWATWAAVKNKVKQMSMASFWLFMLWLMSGLTRLAFSSDRWQLLWVPFMIVAVVLAVCYIYMSNQRRLLSSA